MTHVWNPETGIRAAAAQKWQGIVRFLESGTWNPLLGDFYLIPHFYGEWNPESDIIRHKKILFRTHGNSESGIRRHTV